LHEKLTQNRITQLIKTNTDPNPNLNPNPNPKIHTNAHTHLMSTNST